MTIKDYCLKISKLLKESNKNDWSKLFLLFANQYESDKRDTLTKIRHHYGGMGSFNDLVLYKDGKVNLEEMEKLEKLREGLYKMVVSEIIELNS